jgi:hypothetical protein
MSGRLEVDWMPQALHDSAKSKTTYFPHFWTRTVDIPAVAGGVFILGPFQA